MTALNPNLAGALREIATFADPNGEPQVREAHLMGVGAVSRLEERLRCHYDKRYALCVANATCGLYAVANVLDVGGHDFIAPPLSWGGTIAGFLHAGASPVFADVDPVSMTLDPQSASCRLTNKIQCLVAVDLFGVPADHESLRRVADEHGLWYVHDAAQSLGAYRDGHPAGAFADIIIVSFTIGKTICAGEGGAILTDNAEVYERLLWHTQHPYRQARELGLTNEFGLNMRIHPFAAMLADADFDAALARLAIRQEHGNLVIDALDESELTVPLEYQLRKIQPTYQTLTSAWQTEPCYRTLQTWLDQKGRDAKVRPLMAKPIYQHDAFRNKYPDLKSSRCPTAEAQVKRSVEIHF